MYVLTAEHLAAATERNIHIIRDDVDFREMEHKLRDAAASLPHILAEIDGRTTADEPSVIEAISAALQFPLLDQADAETSWNSVADFMGDLSWLRTPEGRPGIILLFRYPDVLASRDTVSFATLLDIVSVRARPGGLMRPFHFVLGPLSYRYEYLGNIMQASQHFCMECQMVD